MASIIITATGAGTFKCPPGFNNCLVEVWGGGGGGGGSANTTFGGSGGGGGAYAAVTVTGMVAGNTYPFTVGTGGAAGSNANNGVTGVVSTFTNNSSGNSSLLVSAAAGVLGRFGSGNAQEIGGNGGAKNTSTGVTSFAGGTGANGNATVGGGAGESGGPLSIGANGAGKVGGATVTNAGNGGNGGNNATTGNNGIVPGGGGGGAGANGDTGGNGAAGQIRITLANKYFPLQQAQGGVWLRKARIPIFNLTAAADNTVAHGLPATPIEVEYVPAVTGALWSETQPADATNLYIHVGTSGATAGFAYASY